MDRLGWKTIIVFTLVLSALSLGGYLGSSVRTTSLGFPLDDAWIHQTYARNLAQLGEWSFIPGRSSAGSTAPLWSLLLIPGQLMSNGYFLWTFLLGWILLSTLALLGALLMSTWGFSDPRIILASITLILFEWHLVWAAGSGMETLLMGNLILLVLYMLMKEPVHWLAVGFLTGISVWVRPDGITLVGPACMVLFLAPLPFSVRLRNLIYFGAAVL